MRNKTVVLAYETLDTWNLEVYQFSVVMVTSKYVDPVLLRNTKNVNHFYLVICIERLLVMNIVQVSCLQQSGA